MDPIGIIDETDLLGGRGDRCLDDTAPDMPSALQQAGEWLAVGATKVALVATRWCDVEHTVREGQLLVTIEGHDALWPDDEDDE
jgi:hypothetical protein